MQQGTRESNSADKYFKYLTYASYLKYHLSLAWLQRTLSCSSRVRMFPASTQVVSLRCGGGSSSSESSEEVRRIEPKSGGEGVGKKDWEEEREQKGDIFF